MPSVVQLIWIHIFVQMRIAGRQQSSLSKQSLSLCARNTLLGNETVILDPSPLPSGDWIYRLDQWTSWSGDPLMTQVWPNAQSTSIVSWPHVAARVLNRQNVIVSRGRWWGSRGDSEWYNCSMYLPAFCIFPFLVIICFLFSPLQWLFESSRHKISFLFFNS